MRKLLACDSYALELGPGGLSLGRVVAGVAQSLLGRFQVVAEGLGGRPILTTSEAALYALIDTAASSCAIQQPTARACCGRFMRTSVRAVYCCGSRCAIRVPRCRR